MIINNSFCPIPWIHSMLSTNGAYWMCCLAKDDAQLSPSGEAFKKPFDDYRNIDYIKNVRATMLSGKLPDTCEGCILDEQIGNKSKRMSVLDQYNDVFEDAKTHTMLDGEIDITKFPIRYRDHRFGNKCNLRCTICDCYNSDQWIPEAKEFWNIGPPTSRNDLENSIYFKSILEENENIDRLYFAGGEPLIHDAHHLYLEHLIKNKKAKNIIIEYNTNLLALSNKIIDLWKHFKRIEVYISFEGIYEYYEFLRFPGKWKVLEKNIKKIRSLNIAYDFMIVVNIYNILHLIDVIQWTDKIGKIFYPRFLYMPTCLDARNVKNKKNIIDKWELFLDNHKYKNHYMPIINFLKQNVNYDYNKFIHFDQMLCKSRNLDSKKLFKHL